MNNTAEIIFEIKEPVNYTDFKREGISLSLFGADWCRPYHVQKDIFNHVYENQKDKAKFAIVNIDECIDLGIEQNLTSFPALILAKDGVVIDKMFGVVSQNSLEDKIRALI